MEQFIEKLNIDLSEEQEQSLNSFIDDHKSEIDQARENFMDRVQGMMFNWDDFVTHIRKGPWEGSSNLNMPLTAMMVKTFHARLYDIFSQLDTTTLSPRDFSDDNITQMASMLRSWYLFDYINEFKGIRSFTREITYDTVTVGFGIGMKDFYEKKMSFIDVVPNELKREMQDLAPQIGENAEIIQKLQGIQTEEEEAETRVDIKPYKEVKKIITSFKGSRIRSIPFEDAYFPNYIPGSNDLDYPPCVIIETEMTLSEIYAGAMAGEWSMEKAKEIDEKGSDNKSTTRSQNIKEQQGTLTGYNEIDAGNEKQTRTIQYCFVRINLEEEDMFDEYVVMRTDSKIILKIKHLNRVSGLGCRPLIKFDCFTKSRQAYSRSVPEMLHSLQKEMNQHHNMRIDAFALQTLPFGAYRSSSSLKKQPIQLSPGKFIPVDEVSDIKTLSFQTDASVLANEEDRVLAYADKLMSHSSLQQGIIPDRVGPTRSTSGVYALLKQMDKEFKPVVDACAEQWKKLEKMLLFDLDTYVPREIKTRVLGPSIEEFKTISKSDHKKLARISMLDVIAHSFDIKIDVANAIENEEVKRNDAQIILNAVNSPSLAHQFGIIGPIAIYKAWDKWLRSYGIDPKEYGITEPDFITKPLTLYQEIEYCKQGDIPPMSMQDNHGAKAMYLQAFMNEPEYIEMKEMGVASPMVDDLMIMTIQKHMQLQEVLQPKGMPNPTGNNNYDRNADMTGKGQNQEQGTKNAKERNGNRDGSPQNDESSRMGEPSNSSGETQT